MNITLAPTTASGRWAVGLIVTFGASIGVLGGLVALAERGGETFFSNLTLAIPGLLAAIFGIAALFAGLFALVSGKDRSILVFAATAIGLLVLVWVGSELLFPH